MTQANTKEGGVLKLSATELTDKLLYAYYTVYMLNSIFLVID